MMVIYAREFRTAAAKADCFGTFTAGLQGLLHPPHVRIDMLYRNEFPMTQPRNFVFIGCAVLFVGLPLSRSATLVSATTQGTGTSVDSRETNRRIPEKWKSLWSGNGKAADGTFLELNSYENSAGIRVSVTQGKFSSPTAAQKELDLWAKHAIKIIERTVKKNSYGQPIDVRARGIFPPTKPHEEYSAILWTDGDKYYWVSSPSMDLALQVEKDINTHSSMRDSK